MKTPTALHFLAAFCFLTQAKLQDLQPLKTVVSANPQNTTEERRFNISAPVHSIKHFPSFKKGTKSEPARSVNASDIDHRIINGRPADRGQFPWQVAIVADSSRFCGGSLISDTWVLTAAHCTVNVILFEVTLGTTRLSASDSGSAVMITYVSIEHSQYSATTHNNDIALMRLLAPVDFTLYISSIRLPSRSQVTTSFAGATARCSGWGRVSDLSPGPSDTLQYVDMSVITNSQCMETFPTLITASKICVSTAELKSPCNGDSGGPLVIQEDDGRYTEIGIVSFGHTSGCEEGHPAVFTRVTSYLDWIERNTGITIA